MNIITILMIPSIHSHTIRRSMPQNLKSVGEKMTTKMAIELMENELHCVQTASQNLCDRECDKCPLVRNTDDIIKAYGMAIKALEKICGEIE